MVKILKSFVTDKDDLHTCIYVITQSLEKLTYF